MPANNLFPAGAPFTPAELADHPHPHLHQLRRAEPVSWLPALGGWLVTGYDLACAVMRDPTAFTVDHPGFSTAQVVGPSMLSLDGESHQRHRMPFDPPFRRRPVEARFRTPVDQIATRLLEELAPAGRGDLLADFAAPLAVETMIVALGLERVPTAGVLAWYETIVASVTGITAGEPPSPAGEAAFAALGEALQPALAQAGGEESLLAAAAGGSAGLSDQEIIANAAVLLFGGIETTAGMIANAFYFLLTLPDVFAGVRAGRLPLDGVLEESLRLEPAAAVVDRYATADVVLGGAEIRAGELVRVSLSGANRDPAVFPEPDRFDPLRPNLRSHVAFAQGPHVCLGLHLARLEGQAALGQTLERLPGLRLAAGQAVQTAARPRGLVFRKPAALLVRWSRLDQS